MVGQAETADIFAALGFVRAGDLVLWEDGFIRALGYASAAVDAGVRIDVVPGLFLDGQHRHDALHRADFHATGVAQTQAGDDIGHWIVPPNSLEMKRFDNEWI